MPQSDQVRKILLDHCWRWSSATATSRVTWHVTDVTDRVNVELSESSESESSITTRTHTRQNKVESSWICFRISAHNFPTEGLEARLCRGVPTKFPPVPLDNTCIWRTTTTTWTMVPTMDSCSLSVPRCYWLSGRRSLDEIRP